VAFGSFLCRMAVAYGRMGKDTESCLVWKRRGASLNGFVNGAIAKTVCPPEVPAAACHPDVQMWYASFLDTAVSSNVMLWSNAIAVGEFLVGLGLIVGCIVGITAFFGVLMNLNFLLAGQSALTRFFSSWAFS